MNLITTFALGLIFVVWATSAGKSRTKRALWNFGRMIKCGTGRSPFDYNNYACHCGKGGGGKTLDKVDKCCLAHDNCYDNLLAAGTCKSKLRLYVTSYDHTCTVCDPGNVGCAKGLCDCDSTAVNCFKASPYNPALKKSWFTIWVFRWMNCCNTTIAPNSTATTPVVTQTTIPGFSTTIAPSSTATTPVVTQTTIPGFSTTIAPSSTATTPVVTQTTIPGFSTTIAPSTTQTTIPGWWLPIGWLFTADGQSDVKKNTVEPRVELNPEARAFRLKRDAAVAANVRLRDLANEEEA